MQRAVCLDHIQQAKGKGSGQCNARNAVVIGCVASTVGAILLVMFGR
eukprot:COSAG06_NODE_416_length_15996_cov_260.778637_3_plen_47_part_00